MTITAIAAAPRPIASAPASPSDPILETVAEYKRQLAIFEALPDDVVDNHEDEWAARTWKPHYDALFTMEPVTIEGAREALRYASTESSADTVVQAIVRNVVAFLDRARPGEAGTLLPLMLAYEQATATFNTCGSGHPEHDRLENAMLEATNALQAAVDRGTDCVSLEEAEVATRVAVKEYTSGDNEIAAGLALAALAVFLGSEAVS